MYKFQKGGTTPSKTDYYELGKSYVNKPSNEFQAMTEKIKKENPIELVNFAKGYREALESSTKNKSIIKNQKGGSNPKRPTQYQMDMYRAGKDNALKGSKFMYNDLKSKAKNSEDTEAVEAYSRGYRDNQKSYQEGGQMNPEQQQLQQQFIQWLAQKLGVKTQEELQAAVQKLGKAKLKQAYQMFMQEMQGGGQEQQIAKQGAKLKKYQKGSKLKDKLDVERYSIHKPNQINQEISNLTIPFGTQNPNKSVNLEALAKQYAIRANRESTPKIKIKAKPTFNKAKADIQIKTNQQAIDEAKAMLQQEDLQNEMLSMQEVPTLKTNLKIDEPTLNSKITKFQVAKPKGEYYQGSHKAYLPNGSKVRGVGSNYTQGIKIGQAVNEYGADADPSTTPQFDFKDPVQMANATLAYTQTHGKQGTPKQVIRWITNQKLENNNSTEDSKKIETPVTENTQPKITQMRLKVIPKSKLKSYTKEGWKEEKISRNQLNDPEKFKQYQSELENKGVLLPQDRADRLVKAGKTAVIKPANWLQRTLRPIASKLKNIDLNSMNDAKRSKK